MVYKPFDYKTDCVKRLANRLGLSFCIDDFNFLVDFNDGEVESRPANEYEIEMWNLLVPYAGSLKVVTEIELSSYLCYFKGNAYINPIDFEVFKKFSESIVGNSGKYRDCVIRSSDQVLQGYIYKPKEEDLISGDTRIEELDSLTQMYFSQDLHPILQKHYGLVKT